MIDIKVLRENPELFRASQRARGEEAALVDAVLSADEARRSAINERSEERRVGKECTEQCRSRWSPYH